MLRGLFLTSNPDDILAALDDQKHSRKRSVHPAEITCGAIIGTRILASVGAAGAGRWSITDARVCACGRGWRLHGTVFRGLASDRLIATWTLLSERTI